MRSFLPAILLVVVLCTCCSKSGVPFQRTHNLAPAERQSISALHPGLAIWYPTDSALWFQRGSKYNVYINQSAFGSITISYFAFVFDAQGNVVEGNRFTVGNPSTAIAVYGISPLRIGFAQESGSGKIYVCSGDYPLTVWRRDIQIEMTSNSNLEQIVEVWRRSGSTNWAEVTRKIDNEITRSREMISNTALEPTATAP